MKSLFNRGWSALVVGLLSCSLVACGDPGDENDGKGGGEGENPGLTFGKVNLTSTQLNGSALQAVGDVDDCGFSVDIYRGEGSCTTPVDYRGYARLITANSLTNTSPDAEARIAGVRGGNDEEEGAIFTGAEFSFKDQSAFTGWNELWSQYESKPLYGLLSTEMVYEQVQFRIDSKYVTMLLVAHSQPFASSAAVAACELSADEQSQSASRFAAADLLTGMTFTRGDYLFCVKDSASAPCAPTDFQWYDLDSDTLSSTRPTNPRTQAYLVKDAPTCQREGEGRFSPSVVGIRVAATMAEKFKLYADYSHGINSAQWPDAVGAMGEEPDPAHLVDDGFEETYLIYYHQAEAATEVTEGTNLNMTFDFDITGQVFFEGLATDEVTDTNLNAVLKVAHTRHNFYWTKRAATAGDGFDISHAASMTVTPTLELSGGSERPTLVP